MQSTWYITSLRWKGENQEAFFLTGASIVGIPIFTYARSKYSAWGVTAANPDKSDLFIEKVEGDQYEYDGKWHKLRQVKETFKIRFSNDIVHYYNYTHNGVMIEMDEKDEFDYATYFPIEFLTQSAHNFSLKWAYT